MQPPPPPQCTQLYKQTEDVIVNEDPAAVIGADENGPVPALTGEYADLSAQEATREQQAAQNRAIPSETCDEMDSDADDVKMVVVDGVVIAPIVDNINNFIITYTNFIF